MLNSGRFIQDFSVYILTSISYYMLSNKTHFNLPNKTSVYVLLQNCSIRRNTEYLIRKQTLLHDTHSDETGS